jgi:hypothetical protein
MSILSDELSKPEYIGLSDQAAADSINAKTVVAQQSVAIRDLKTYAIFQGIWPKLLAGEKSSNPQVAGLCQSVVAWVDDPRISTVDVNMPQVQAMLTQLVGATIITQEQASDIVAMGSKQIAWTTSVGLPEIGIGLVINARREINANEVQI